MKLILFLLLPVLCFGQLLTEIDNQILHLKGDVWVTVTGAGVSLWADQSGLGNDFTQTTDADRPEWVSSSYLDFDAANTEWLTCADDNDFTFGNGTTDTPFSFVCRINMDEATTFRILMKSTDNSNMEYAIGTWTDDKLSVQLIDKSIGNYIQRFSDDALTAGSWMTIGISYDGSGVSGLIFYKNGEVLPSTAGANVGTYVAMENTNGSLRLGQTHWNSYTDGKMQDILMTKDVITPTEMGNIHIYFTTGTYPVTATTTRKRNFGGWGWGGWLK